ncbi:DNA-directed RNA polymerase II core subunit [Knufia peltigerae]|uniref:DNA-directed RNA polymerase II core subunit n=1 Tax=Knufia peltigerae TaxID=1002370 RepID=A0AA38XNB1_9EURO|nr:DNA-directed RNA polymerase II core subunit [Knufia peltigerae]
MNPARNKSASPNRAQPGTSPARTKSASPSGRSRRGSMNNALHNLKLDDNNDGTREKGTTVRNTLTVNIDTINSGPLTPGPSSPKPGDTYPGSGKRGIPQDGVAWRDHLSNKRYHNAGINHNAINNQDRCAKETTTSEMSSSFIKLGRVLRCWALVFLTEAFILGDGEKKIEQKIDTRTPNTVIFTFNKEDHTLANMLREKLLENSHVMFAAYKVPHPLFASFELRIQTDGDITPKEALIASSKEIIKELDVLKHRFKKEYDLRKMVGNVGQNGA